MPYADPVKQRECARRGYARNREKRRAQARALAAKPEQKLKRAAWQRANRANLNSRYQKYRAERMEFLRSYKAAHPCVDCGEPDPIVLQFDHRDPSAKSFNLSEAVSGHHISFDRIIAEIAKCDIRCANCHIRRSVREGHIGRGPKSDA